MSNLVLMMKEHPDGHAVVLHVHFEDGECAQVEGAVRHSSPELARAAGLKLHAMLAEVIGPGADVRAPRGVRVH